MGAGVKYPRTHGPRTQKKRAKNKPLPDPPHERVQKEVHGQLVWVKVYEPAWKLYPEPEPENVGFKLQDNPFMRDRW
jgi:hypothetical protein